MRSLRAETGSGSQWMLGKGLLGGAMLLLAWALWSALAISREGATRIPAPVLDEAASPAGATETVVLAGGCFWGVQAVFQHVNGVSRAVSGYSGGTKETATYELVSNGRTGHAEAVAVTFDPKLVSLGTILHVFFSVAHNPTELNRQGPDVGPQYRSAIFVADERQRRMVAAYIAQLDKAGVFRKHIATRVDAMTAFYPAEAYHQDYATLNPNNPYIAIHDRPKIDDLRTLFPAQFRVTPMLVGTDRPKG